MPQDKETLQPPPAPDEIPQYIVDALHRQFRKPDKETLEAVERYAADLRAALIDIEAAGIGDKDELEGPGEEIDDIKEDTDGRTLVIKKVPCGKNCSGCPHGPYLYSVKRVGDSLEWKYHHPVKE